LLVRSDDVIGYAADLVAAGTGLSAAVDQALREVLGNETSYAELRALLDGHLDHLYPGFSGVAVAASLVESINKLAIQTRALTMPAVAWATFPPGGLFLSSLEPVLLHKPATLMHTWATPDLEHPNVAWYAGDTKTAQMRLRDLVRQQRWFARTESGYVYIAPTRFAKGAVVATFKPMTLPNQRPATAIVAFGNDLANLKNLFAMLRSATEAQTR
jgi:hypothetical protein